LIWLPAFRRPKIQALSIWSVPCRFPHPHLIVFPVLPEICSHRPIPCLGDQISPMMPSQVAVFDSQLRLDQDHPYEPVSSQNRCGYQYATKHHHLIFMHQDDLSMLSLSFPVVKFLGDQADNLAIVSPGLSVKTILYKLNKVVQVWLCDMRCLGHLLF
jgi:hypothetical protein